MTALSPVQREMLRLMYFANGISYADRHDRTMMALKRRGLAEFHPRRKYGRDCWHLTNVGKGRAAQTIASDARRKRDISEIDLADAMCHGSGA
jgi:hypothetical protein